MLDRREKEEQVELKAHADEKLSLEEPAESSHIEPIGGVPAPTPPLGPVQRTGRWTPDEKILFLYGLKSFGKGRWKKISVYLPNRSLVQIKSHAQKVLKRLDAGENVFRRLDENYNNIDSLIVQAAKQRVALLKSSSSKSMSEAAKLKRVTKRPMEQVPKDSSLFIEQKSEQISPLGSFGSESQTHFDAEAGRGAVIAAAALCQLSSLGWNQKHQSTIQKSF